MKKFAVCLVLLLASMPLLAIGTGIGIGLTGGIEMMVPDSGDSETYPAIGAVVDFSLPGMPIGLRGGGEYAWKSFEGDVSSSVIFILLAGQYNIVLPGAPMNFYIGAGPEIAMSSYSVGEISNTETDFGVLGYVGANYNMGGMGIFAEVGYGMIFAEDETTGALNYTHIPMRGGIKISL